MLKPVALGGFREKTIAAVVSAITLFGGTPYSLEDSSVIANGIRSDGDIEAKP